MSAPIGIIDITFLYNYREEKTRLTWQPIVVFLIFLFSSFFYTTYSQSYYIKKYTVNDGLPASYIISIYQDTQGFMWISTYNGLSRFDGKEFINYGYESGLPYIICDAIYEDKKNHIWVGTRNGMAEVKGKHCVVYPLDDSLNINYVFGFHEMKNGNLWALTNKGVYQFEENHWKKIKLYPGFENHSCVNVIETDSGLLINYGHHIVLKKGEKSFQLINQITQDDAIGPAFLEMYQQDGLLYLNRSDVFFEIKGKDSAILFNNELANKYVLHTHKDSKARFWVYTLKDQLMVSAPGDMQHFVFKMAVQLVDAFFEDHEGNMWIACSDGLLKIRQVSHENFEKKFTTNITGHCNVINTSGNQLLISGANGVLFASSKNLFANKDIKFSPIKQSATHHEIIDAWCIDERDRTWLVFREARDLFISENNRVRILHGLVKNNIHPLTGVAYNPHTHKLYVGADTLQSGNEKGLQNFRSTNTGETIIRPTALHYFSNGLILVETRNSGFFIIDDEDNIHSMPRENIIQYQFPGGVRIFDDPSGKFWITSPYGMVRFRWNEKKMPVKDLEITVNQGLPNSAVRSLAFDKLNRVWAATLSGIVVIEIDSSNKNSIIVNRLSEEQGISSDYWVEAKLATDKNGYIWCGLYNQLLRFDPLQLNFEKLLPTIAIDNIQINFKETDWLEWTDSVQGVMQLPYNPVLSYNKNNLGISYKGISFSYASALEYSYKLVGADTNWSMPTHSQIVSYVSLPPGNYNFQVRTRKSNSGWSRPAFFSFIIKKPYWETWLFRLAVLFFVIAAVVAFYKFRLNQIRKIMNLRLKISRDLHDEVGSALSGIGIISEMAKLQVQNEKNNEARQSLEKISANAEEMLVKMSDIIWAINPQNESFEKMISRLKTYTRNVSSPLGIEMHFESDKEAEKINLDMQKINNIYLICKEAINNTVKYSGCSHLGVILKREDHYFSIYINDDGKGFDPEKVFDGNGLKNMHSRAKEMNAKLGIHSGDGKGTSVKLRINIT